MSAVTYRLLRKKILSSVIRGLNIVLMWINSFIIERENKQEGSKPKEVFLEDVRRTLLPFYRFDTEGSLEEMVDHLSTLRSELVTSIGAQPTAKVMVAEKSCT